ncbi:MAG: hypothetical protein V5783_07805 [Pontiella sp.]
MRLSTPFKIAFSVLGLSVAWPGQHPFSRATPAKALPFAATTPASEPIKKTLPARPPQLVHAPQVLLPIKAIPAPEPKVMATALSPAEKRRRATNRYHDHLERNFERQLSQLEKETDPARRAKLIAALGCYVQIDTLATLEWATHLESPEEQRAALESFNKNALTGIGAHIEMNASGLPRIKDTTLLSAAESTGMIQVGDSISGMVTADGATLSFQGMTIQQIVQHLRGQPGTSIQLKLERSPEYGSTQPIPFEVPVQRSLIVMQPPSDG